MALSEEKLFELKERIDSANTTIAELNGQLQVFMKQLKDDWKCNSLEEAEKKLKEYDKEITSLEKQIEKGSSDLEKIINVQQ
jgi:hypothetical protein